MSLRRVTFRIDSHEIIGERLRVDGYLSRIGVQVYSDGFGGIRREYRDPSEVFSEDSLASFRGMAATVQHPREKVTGTNWRRYTIGHVGDDPRRADDGVHVAASVWILDAKTREAVLSGELQELSVGYTAALDETPGTSPDGERYDAKQTEIRGNHVALLKAGQARGGRSVRLRLDSAGDAILADEPEVQKMKFKIDANSMSFDVEAADDNVCRALEKEREDSEKILKDAERAKSEADARADAAEDKVKELEGKLEGFLQAEKAKAQEAIKTDALKIAPKLAIRDTDTPEQIRRCALEESGISTKDKDDAYVAVRFDMVLEGLEKREETPAVVKARKQDRNTPESPCPVFSLDRAARALR